MRRASAALQIVVGDELLQHVLLPFAGELGVLGERVGARGVRDAGEQRAFVGGEVGGPLAKVAFARRADAGVPIAEVDRVHVQFEDGSLRKVLLHRERHEHLGYFAFDGLLLREVLVFRQLLRDGAAALDDGAGAQVVHEGAHCGDGIESGMRVEAVVLHGDGGLQVEVGQLVDGGEARLLLDARGHVVEAHLLKRLPIHVESACGEVQRDEETEDECDRAGAGDDRCDHACGRTGLRGHGSSSPGLVSWCDAFSL